MKTALETSNPNMYRSNSYQVPREARGRSTSTTLTASIRVPDLAVVFGSKADLDSWSIAKQAILNAIIQAKLSIRAPTRKK